MVNKNHQYQQNEKSGLTSIDWTYRYKKNTTTRDIGNPGTVFM